MTRALIALAVLGTLTALLDAALLIWSTPQ